MVTAAQLQLLQSPITALISSISTSVNVKLDDTNYLNWHFQMSLLLESNGILGFVDGTHPCPSQSVVTESGTHSSPSSSSIVSDDVLIWKLHDRALMQLITATLSPIAMSCAIGSVSSRDLWNRLIEQFSIVSKTSIFQMKSNLQNIRKGADSVSQYLLKIKEARDYLTAAGVNFVDEDIIILALNGLPSEYNTFRCVIRGRESVISLTEFRSQLLAEEKIVESIVPAHNYLSAMHVSKPSNAVFGQQQSRGPSYDSGGSRFFNKNRGRGRFNNGFRQMTPRPHYSTKSSPVASNMVVCQLCNREGHLAPVCSSRRDEKPGCGICGRPNHTTWYCYYNDRGPNFSGSTYSPEVSAQSSGTSFGMQALHTGVHPSHSTSQVWLTDSGPYSSMQAMPPVVHPSTSSSRVWLADTGATHHMTSDLHNLSLAASLPVNDTVQTAGGEGQGHRENNLQGVQQ